MAVDEMARLMVSMVLVVVVQEVYMETNALVPGGTGL